MTGREGECLAYTEEVAGSTPASPTKKINGFRSVYVQRYLTL